MNDYIPRLYYGNQSGGGDLSIEGAFNNLNDSFRQLQGSRAVNQANEQLNEINLNETSESQRRVQQNQLANQLGAQMLSLGYPGNQAELFAKAYGPPKVPFTNLAELAAFGSPEEQQKAADFYKQIKPPKQSGEGEAPDDFKRLIKEQNVFAKFTKDISPDEKARGAYGQSVQVMNRAQNLQQLIGPNTSIAELNKISPQFVAEAATSLASMVKNGQVTEGEIHNFLPNTVGMKGAKLQSFLTNMPEGANAGGFLKLYLSSAKRESSLAAQTLAESILTKANGNSALAKINPDRFKQEVASQLNTFAQKALSPDDVLVDSRGRVSTTEQRDMDKKFSLHSKALGEAKMAYNSQDPEKRKKAETYFSRLGLDPEDSITEMRSTLKTRVRAGAFQ